MWVFPLLKGSGEQTLYHIEAYLIKEHGHYGYGSIAK